MTGAVEMAAAKALTGQIVKQVLPAARRIAGLPGQVERAIETAVRRAIADAAQVACTSEDHRVVEHAVGLLLNVPVSYQAQEHLVSLIADPALADVDPDPSTPAVPAISVRVAELVELDWETVCIDPVAFDAELGRALVLAIRQESVAVPALAPIRIALDLGFAFARMRAEMHREFADLRADLERRGHSAAAQGRQDDAPLPLRVLAALEAASPQVRGPLTSLLLSGRPPAEIARDLMEVPPTWFAEADGYAWLALARFLGLHNVRGASGRALFEAAERGAGDRPTLLALAAFEAHAAGDHESAEAWLERAELVDASNVACAAVKAAFAGDSESILVATQSWSAAEVDFVLLVSLRAQALLAEADGEAVIARAEEAVRLLEAAVATRPKDPGLLEQLARVRLASSAVLPQRARRLRRDAMRDALKARDLRRSWNLPSVQQALTAAEAAIGLFDPSSVVSILLAPPAGHATEDEAADPRARSWAAAGLLALERDDAAVKIRNDLQQGRLRWDLSLQIDLHAQIRKPTPERRSRLVDLATLLFETAESDRERIDSVMWLARLGEDEPPGVEHLLASDPKSSDEIRAQRALVSGNHEAALEALGPADTPRAAQLMARAHAQAGRMEVATDLLVEAARQLNEPSLLAQRAYLMMEGLAVRADQWGNLDSESKVRLAAVDAAAKDALGAAPEGPEAKALLSLQASLAYTAGDWRGCIPLARAALEDSDSDDPTDDEERTRWRLVLSLYKLREEAEAWRSLREPVPLQPTTSDQARVSVMLAAACADPKLLLIEATRLIGQFADQSGFRDWFVGVVLLVLDPIMRQHGLADEEGLTEDGAADTDIASANEALKRFVQNEMASGEHRGWKTVTLPDDPQDMVEAVAEMLRSGPEHARLQAEALDRGVPAGALGSGNYATDVLKTSGRVIRVEANDHLIREVELSAARKAVAATIATDLVVDLTALRSGVLVPAFDELVRGWARRLLVTDETVAAAHDARWQFTAPSAGGMGLDAYGRLVMSEADPQQVGAQQERARRLALATKRSHAEPSPGPFATAAEHADLNGVWSHPIVLARLHGVPLLSDDAGQRNLARAEGLVAFSSYALAQALGEKGNAQLQSELVAAWRALAPTDVPATLDELRALSRSSEGVPGPASWPWTRPITWATIDGPLAGAIALLQDLYDRRRDALAGWAHDMTLGLLAAGCSMRDVVAIVFAAEGSGHILDLSANAALLTGAHAACHSRGLGDELLRLAIAETRTRARGAASPDFLVQFQGLPPQIAERVLAIEQRQPSAPGSASGLVWPGGPAPR